MKFLLQLVMFIFLFSGCAGSQMPSSFGLGDPSDDAISCVENKSNCTKHCETIIDGKVVAFIDTPIEGCLLSSTPEKV